MNRDDKGKALHKYLAESSLFPASKAKKSWGSLKEETREEYRTMAVSLAQDLIYGGKYELSLANLDDDQILYNGLFSGVFQRNHQGWFHLLLLRSKDREVRDEEQGPKMAIVTQIPGSLLAIQRQIEHIATLIMNFFSNRLYTHPHDDITITPENTEFIEYIPYSVFSETTDITDETYKQPGEHGSVISLVRFQWQGEKGRNIASDPGWKTLSISTVNAMIQDL